MFFIKKDENYGNKKYLLVIFILIIFAAIGLSIADFFEKRSVQSSNQNNDISQSKIIANHSYLSLDKPEIRESDRVLGNRNAKLKIFVYEDYDNIFSSRLAPTIDQIIKDKGSELAIILRPFISPSNNSIKRALALDCSNNTWPQLRREIMFSLENNLNEDLSVIIKKVGLREDDFFSCLEEKEMSDRADEIRQEALTLQILGTPTIFIVDNVIFGARPYENYKDSNDEEVEGLKLIIDRALESI